MKCPIPAGVYRRAEEKEIEDEFNRSLRRFKLRGQAFEGSASFQLANIFR